MAAYHAAWQWLARQPAGAVLVPLPLHRLYFQFYTNTEGGPGRTLDATARPGRHYRYAAVPQAPGAFQSVLAAAPAFRNALVEIRTLPDTPGAAPVRGLKPGLRHLRQ